MNNSTQPQIALVTGASAGFGRAISERFLRDGYRVIAAARRMEPLRALRQQYGDAVLPVSLDVRDEQAVAGRKAARQVGFVSGAPSRPVHRGQEGVGVPALYCAAVSGKFPDCVYGVSTRPSG